VGARVQARESYIISQEPGTVLVIPYDPMAENAPQTKQRKNKEKEKDKEAKEEKMRIQAQETKKKAKSEEQQILSQKAPIPSLEEIPEGGEWKGAGLGIFIMFLSHFIAFVVYFFFCTFLLCFSFTIFTSPPLTISRSRG
jgi:hypothetical protein